MICYNVSIFGVDSMSLLNKIKNKNIRKKYGWNDIEKAFLKLYPNQTNPKHYGALIKWNLGGNDPLDGISIYDGGDYWHFVSFGLSEIYEKESSNKDISGYGMEFTFKFKKTNFNNLESELKNVCGIFQQLARETFVNGEIFNPYEYIYSGQKEGIDVEQKSKITGFITIPDTKLEEINTINGKVIFVELIGATNDELLAITNKKLTVKKLYEKLNSDITDYERDSVI